jgi:hypothetical protein
MTLERVIIYRRLHGAWMAELQTKKIYEIHWKTVKAASGETMALAAQCLSMSAGIK